VSSVGGVFVAVVGPSGAGKDSLLSAARTSLADDPRFVFARRVITRVADHTEDHDSVDAETFGRFVSERGFVLWWEAHNLSYGLPVALTEQLAQNRVVIANVSRAVLPTIRKTFSRSCVVQITASEETLRQRLASRGRETAAVQQGRLARAQMIAVDVDADVTIANDGEFEDACRRFVEALKAAIPANPEVEPVSLPAYSGT
jgi:ribose 1,5-bisphosphokinase